MTHTIAVVISILILIFIFLMIIYLSYDRSRFQLEQQFTCIKKEIRHILENTDAYDRFCSARGNWGKIKVLSEVCKKPYCEELHTYFDVHNELAYQHNEKMQKGLFHGVARIMGFKEYPLMRYSDELVLTSLSGRKVRF